jgi:hypothetical protein
VKSLLWPLLFAWFCLNHWCTLPGFSDVPRKPWRIQYGFDIKSLFPTTLLFHECERNSEQQADGIEFIFTMSMSMSMPSEPTTYGVFRLGFKTIPVQSNDRRQEID